MKRNIDLCRSLLLAIEEDPDITGLKQLNTEGVSEDEISYHVKLLYEAGLIEAKDASGINAFKWYPIRLTWNGHEFLDAARDETRWNKAKIIVKEKAGGLAFEFVKAALFKLVEL